MNDPREAIPLLREYTEKITGYGEQAKRLRERFYAQKTDSERVVLLQEYDALMQRFNQLHPATVNFARLVSQTIEHMAIEEIAKLELKLRLAELEGALWSAQTLLHIYRPT